MEGPLSAILLYIGMHLHDRDSPPFYGVLVTTYKKTGRGSGYPCHSSSPTINPESGQVCVPSNNIEGQRGGTSIVSWLATKHIFHHILAVPSVIDPNNPQHYTLCQTTDPSVPETYLVNTLLHMDIYDVCI